MKILINYNWRLFLILFLIAISALTIQVICGIITMSSYEYQNISLPELLGFVLLNILGIVFVVFLGLLVSIRLNLQVYFAKNYTKRSNMLVPLALGIMISIIAVALDFILFDGRIEQKVNSMGNVWARLSVIYTAAIGEEILYRFFLMSIILLLVRRLIGFTSKTVWIGIILSSILFAIAHFPKEINQLDLLTITRALLLAGMAGIVFAWVYWRRGLFSAMFTHFAADFTIYLIFPVFWSS